MTFQRSVPVGALTIGNDLPLAILAGPCQLETLDHALKMAHALMTLSQKLGIPFVFKSSFDKANRTSVAGKRGVGLDASLRIFEEIKRQVGCPIVTDVHTEEQCAAMASVVDMLQIPAFLCRQTDLLLAAGATGKPVNVKKGQFLSPQEMTTVAAKIASTGNHNILLCERGTTFGYNNLVVDMRALPIMKQTGYPVVMDATHAVMQPGAKGTSSSGQREFAPVLARAAVALGIASVFMEVHDNPDTAPSDGANMIKLEDAPKLWAQLKELDAWAKANPLSIETAE